MPQWRTEFFLVKGSDTVRVTSLFILLSFSVVHDAMLAADIYLLCCILNCTVTFFLKEYLLASLAEKKNEWEQNET